MEREVEAMRWRVVVVMVDVAVAVSGYEEGKKRRGGVSDNMATHQHNTHHPSTGEVRLRDG